MKYSHECIEYDGLLIDEKCLEFSGCSCFTDEQAKVFLELHNLYLDQIQSLYGIIRSLRKKLEKSV